MREDLSAGLQQLWEAALRDRLLLSRRSPVVVLDEILTKRDDP